MDPHKTHQDYRDISRHSRSCQQNCNTELEESKTVWGICASRLYGGTCWVLKGTSGYIRSSYLLVQTATAVDSRCPCAIFLPTAGESRSPDPWLTAEQGVRLWKPSCPSCVSCCWEMLRSLRCQIHLEDHKAKAMYLDLHGCIGTFSLLPCKWYMCLLCLRVPAAVRSIIATPWGISSEFHRQDSFEIRSLTALKVNSNWMSALPLSDRKAGIDSERTWDKSGNSCTLDAWQLNKISSCPKNSYLRAKAVSGWRTVVRVLGAPFWFFMSVELPFYYYCS